MLSFKLNPSLIKLVCASIQTFYSWTLNSKIDLVDKNPFSSKSLSPMRKMAPGQQICITFKYSVKNAFVPFLSIFTKIQFYAKMFQIFTSVVSFFLLPNSCFQDSYFLRCELHLFSLLWLHQLYFNILFKDSSNLRFLLPTHHA